MAAFSRWLFFQSYSFDKEVKTEILSHPKKKEIFSALSEGWRTILWSPHPFMDEDLNNKGKKILKIIGQTIIDNDLITYMIYIIAFWCKYLLTVQMVYPASMQSKGVINNPNLW